MAEKSRFFVFEEDNSNIFESFGCFSRGTPIDVFKNFYLGIAKCIKFGQVNTVYFLLAHR
jgi:hypothetical protein